MSSQIIEPSFSPSIIQDKRSDGYWIEKFHFHSDDQVPGLLVSGLNSGKVQFLENPLNEKGKGSKKIDEPWTVHTIAEFDTPVAVIAAPIRPRSGLMDVVLCHDYGPNMIECNLDGGWVSWLENPGRENLGKKPWTKRTIGRWPAMHRLKGGYFTSKSIFEVIGAPVVHGQHDRTTPVPIFRFQAPEKQHEATEWRRDIVDDEHFTIVHELVVKKFHGPTGLDSLLVGSREGISWLYYERGTWNTERLGIGEPYQPGQSWTSEVPGSGDHWGTGTLDAGRIGDDPFAYIATMNPFHGGAVCVYTKTNRGLHTADWARHDLDMYGTPNQAMKYGDGPGHFLVCGDFDGDGNDEFLISLMGSLDREPNPPYDAIPPKGGPNPNKGIVYYKAIDLENGIFAKWKIAEESSGRVAIGNFNAKNKLDVASIKYHVQQYYEEPNPTVNLYVNQTQIPESTFRKKLIVPSLWNGEAMIYVSKPSDIAEAASLPLIEIANYAISVAVFPQKSKVSVKPGEGIKVLYGTLQDSNGATRRPLGGAPFPCSASTLCQEGSLTTGDVGAIVLLLTPVSAEADWEDLELNLDDSRQEWSNAADIPVHTTLDLSDVGLKMPALNFRKVEDLWWGEKFKDVEFYNLTGFHFAFLESKVKIAHMQFWIAGPGVSAGAHNHSNDMFQEIHIGLSLGTQSGGMSKIRPQYADKTAEEAEALPPSAWSHVEIPPQVEHGAIWHQDSYGKAVRGRNRVVSYPWHKWQAGDGENLDIWLALEFNPDVEL
ncbi:hypothetical protein GGR57DRAFT_513367 [Xylariaceae sp. FL1272]|nr:hypothetical protein GGR57DRAFT_513367 [Xylariaceae sp. FL1272]